MAWNLHKVLREGQLLGAWICWPVFFSVNHWAGVAAVTEKELCILVSFPSLRAPDTLTCLTASANANDIANKWDFWVKGCCFPTSEITKSKWLIAPSSVVFIQIICPYKRLNLLELILYSCWKISKCSKRELSNPSPPDAIRGKLPSVSLTSCIKFFFFAKKSAVLFQSQTLLFKDALFGSWWPTTLDPGLPAPVKILGVGSPDLKLTSAVMWKGANSR